jgi:hypothetical protein
MAGDYMKFNPTSNRTLDFMPVFICPNDDTIHYRPPFSPSLSWNLAQEWNDWVAVERLACESERLRKSMRTPVSNAYLLQA